VYGFGSSKYEQSSEHMVGRFANSWRNQAQGGGGGGGGGVSPVIGSKVFTIPWTNTIMGGGLRTSPDSLVTALQGSVGRVGGPLDLWSIHFPFPVRALLPYDWAGSSSNGWGPRDRLSSLCQHVNTLGKAGSCPRLA